MITNAMQMQYTAILFAVLGLAAACSEPKLATTHGGAKVASGQFGSQPGQFGATQPEEANPEAPMSLVATDQGLVYVLDQQNQRIQIFHAGAMERTIPIPYPTVQDLALLQDGRLVLLDRLARRKLFVIDDTGKLLDQIELEGPGIEEGGGTQGLFTRSDGIWVDYDGNMVRVLDAQGHPDPARPTVSGRLSLDGTRLISLDVRPAGLGVVSRERSGLAHNRTAELVFSEPVSHVLAHDMDGNGKLYVITQHGSGGGSDQMSTAYLSVLDADLKLERQIALAAPSGGREVFRHAHVTPAGSVYYLQLTDSDVAVRRY
jgi:hypothetical protein